MSHFLPALGALLEPKIFVLILICSFAGIVFGAIPGLSGGMGVSLLLPLTFGMDTITGFAMMLSMWVGGVSGGFISATLIGIPGAPSSIATCYDAYPMSQRGETSRALSIGIFGSFFGTAVSIIIAAIVCPYVAKLAISLGPWEYFSLCLCALMLVSSLSRGNIFKALLSALLGMFFAMIGTSVMDGVFRFTFGTTYLKAGVDMVPMMLGTFAVAQIAMDYAKGRQELPQSNAKIKGVGLNLKDFTQNIVVIIKSFLIGLWIGFLPGMGSGISNMIAYGQAKSGHKEADQFGKGHPGGIWASEVSNNASVGGALIPMITLGIPGDGTTALLMTALMVHGLQPGPMFITSQPKLVYVIFACVLLSAIVVVLMQTLGIRWFPAMLKIPYHYLFGVILIICIAGAFASQNNIITIFAAIVFGAIGILLNYFDLPNAPMILTFVLGSKIEEYFRKGISYTDKGIMPFITRPVSLLFLVLAVLSVLWPMVKPYIKKKQKAE